MNKIPPKPDDIYWKLRPLPHPEKEDICHCENRTAVMLRDSFSQNPVQCLTCNGEVPPEQLGYDAQLVEEIACWRSIYRSLYLLWLDSGEYETWAAEKLASPASKVNVQGRDIVRRLNGVMTSYYWWFNDTEIEEKDPPSNCPYCASPLKDFEERNFQICDNCLILI